MEKILDTNELVSALADGELRGDAFVHAMEILESDARARAAWHNYHQIGDVLRSGELAANFSSAGFVARIQVRLALESDPAIRPIDAELTTHDGVVTMVAGSPVSQSESANQPVFRWKLLAGVASLAAGAAVVWNLAAPPMSGTAQVELVRAPQASSQDVAVAAGAGTVMIRDPRLDELLAAHRQAGGASALQMPSGFLRNATFDGPAR